MSIYNLLKDIVQNKKGNLHDSHEFETMFASPFLVQRWLSMLSPDTTMLINDTSNKLWKGLADDKVLWYRLYLALIDKKRFGKINYIKKDKKEINKTEVKITDVLAQRNEISTRETESNLELMKLINKDIMNKFKKLINTEKVNVERD